jgi:nicotinate-nucleotide adenylyltransferase
MSWRRFDHCVNVCRVAGELAKKYGANKDKAMIAGMLHDITKESSLEYHMNIIRKFKIPITKHDTISKGILHSITGSTYAEKVLRIRDRDIINAIKYHTTGREGMSLLEKVVFVADFISEERDYQGVDRIRKCAWEDLDLGALAGLLFSINNLIKIKIPIHPNTVLAYNDIVIHRRRQFNSEQNPPFGKQNL